VSTTRPFLAFELPLDADDGPFGPSASAQGWWWERKTDDDGDAATDPPSTAPRFTQRPGLLAPEASTRRSRSA
jgi:hypothetical protein